MEIWHVKKNKDLNMIDELKEDLAQAATPNKSS